MFLTYKDKIKEIEDLYNKKEINVVILESANLIERFIGEFFNTFHSNLPAKEDLEKYIEFQDHEGEKYASFLKKPTIGIAIGYYTKLRQQFPSLKVFEQDIREKLNTVNEIRISNLHSKGNLVADEDAGKILDAGEKIISLCDYRDKPIETNAVPLKYYLISMSVIRKFEHADREEDYIKITSDSLKIIPVLVKAFLNHKFHEMDSDEKYVVLETVDFWSKGDCNCKEFKKILESTRLVKKISQGDSLKESIAFLSDYTYEEYNRRATRHYVNTIEILIKELTNENNLSVLRYADSIKRRYLVGNKLDRNDRLLLNEKAQELDIPSEITRKIETQVIDTINKELILFQTLTDDQEKFKQPVVTELTSAINLPVGRKRIAKLGMILFMILLIIGLLYITVFRKQYNLTRYEKLAFESKWNKVLQITNKKRRDIKNTKANFLYLLSVGFKNQWLATEFPESYNDEYRELLRENPESPEARFYLGCSFEYRSEWNEERDSSFMLIKDAAEKGLDSKEFDFVRRGIYAEIGLNKELFEMTEKLKNMNDPRALNDAASTYLENIYDTATAIQLLNKAITLYPRYVDAINRLANLYLNKNDLSQAELYIGRSMKINPKDYSTVELNARIKKAEGRFDDAENLYKYAINTFGKDNPGFYVGLIEIYTMKDSIDLAFNFLTEAKKKFPDYTGFYYEEVFINYEKEKAEKIKTKLRQSDNWMDDYNLALKRANEENKIIVINFINFSWNDIIDNYIFSDSVINQKINNCLYLKINLDKNVDIAKKFQVIRPTILMINKDEEPIKKSEIYNIYQREKFIEFFNEGLNQFRILEKAKYVTEEKRTIANNFQNAKILSKNFNFPIMMIIGDKQSDWSSRLMNECNSRKEILSQFDSTIFLYLDKSSSDPIIRRMNTSFYPSIYFFNKNTEKIYEVEGYKSPSEIVRLIQKVKLASGKNIILTPDINWFFSIDEARSDALLQKKNIFLFITESNSPYSNERLGEIFKNQEIINKLKSDYTCIFMNLYENYKSLKEYNIDPISGFLILDESGKELFRTSSDMDRNQLLLWLDLDKKLKTISTLGIEKFTFYMQNLSNAYRLFDRGYYQSADNLLEELSELVPDDAEITYRRGQISSFLQHDEDAIIRYEMAIRLGKDLTDEGDFIWDIILNYMQTGQYNRGINFFKAHASDPDVSRVQKSYSYRIISELNYYKDQIDSAIYFADKAVTINSEDFYNQLSYGLLTYRINKLDVSDRILQKAEQLNKFNGLPTIYRGMIEEKKGNFFLREKFFNKAKIDDSYILGRVNYKSGIIFRGSNNFWECPNVKKEIEESIDISLKLDSMDWYFYCMEYYITEPGFEKEALKLCKSALDRYNYIYTSKVHYALALLLNKKNDEALKMMNEIFEEVNEKTIRTDFDCLFAAAKIYILNNIPDKANHYYMLLKKCRPIYGYKILWMRDIDQIFKSKISGKN